MSAQFKIEIVPPLSRLEVLLLNWADWQQRSRANISAGYPTRACGIVTNNTDFEDIENILDTQIAKVVDAIVQDLPDEERSAINHKYLGSRFLYDSDGFAYVNLIHNAKRLIQSGVERKGIW